MSQDQAASPRVGDPLDISQLRNVFIDKLVIHAIDLALYQAAVQIQGTEHLVTLNGGYLRSHNILSLQARFESLHVAAQVLRHQSCYDEMIGQPQRQFSNLLEVPLGNSQLGVCSDSG